MPWENLTYLIHQYLIIIEITPKSMLEEPRRPNKNLLIAQFVMKVSEEIDWIQIEHLAMFNLQYSSKKLFHTQQGHKIIFLILCPYYTMTLWNILVSIRTFSQKRIKFG